MQRKRIRFLAGAALACFASIALAQQKAPQAQYWYGGLSYGQSIIDLHNDAVPIAGNPPSTLNAGQSNTGYRLFAGYRAARHFALEGSYTDLAHTTATRTSSGGELRADLRLSGWGVDGLGILPFDNGFSLFGKAGLVRATMAATYTATGGVAPPAQSDPRETKGSFKYGGGAFYDLNEHFSLRADYEVIKNVGRANTGQADVKFLSAGVLYRF